MFRFKQFTIHQDKTPMKVCTDSCVMGAWVPVENSQRILDIGTGTGLLALMAAQRTQAAITAIEPDEITYQQALQNVAVSPFASQIQIINQDLDSFVSNQDILFDTIICNPPFFSNSILSNDERKNSALHQTTLSFENLVKGIASLSSEDGIAYILISPYETKRLQQTAENIQLYSSVGMRMWANNKKHIRDIVVLSKQNKDFTTQDFYIKQEGDEYTAQMKQLMQPYYLHF
ncbi:MAG: methyltransferase [Cytophagaceae bacterium]